MSDWQEGDLVEAIKDGRASVKGFMHSDAIEVCVGMRCVRFPITEFKLYGYTLTVIERAVPKVELPTEPGHYQDADGRHWLHQIYGGSAYGAPYRDVDQWVNFNGNIVDDPESYAPFTRLEPVADTARKVLASINEKVGDINMSMSRHGDVCAAIDRVAAEFGVQS